MKKIFLIFAMASLAIIFASCGNKEKQAELDALKTENSQLQDRLNRLEEQSNKPKTSTSTGSSKLEKRVTTLENDVAGLKKNDETIINYLSVQEKEREESKNNKNSFAEFLKTLRDSGQQ